MFPPVSNFCQPVWSISEASYQLLIGSLCVQGYGKEAAISSQAERSSTCRNSTSPAEWKMKDQRRTIYTVPAAMCGVT